MSQRRWIPHKKVAALGSIKNQRLSVPGLLASLSHFSEGLASFLPLVAESFLLAVVDGVASSAWIL